MLLLFTLYLQFSIIKKINLVHQGIFSQERKAKKRPWNRICHVIKICQNRWHIFSNKLLNAWSVLPEISAKEGFDNVGSMWSQNHQNIGNLANSDSKQPCWSDEMTLQLNVCSVNYRHLRWYVRICKRKDGILFFLNCAGDEFAVQIVQVTY